MFPRYPLRKHQGHFVPRRTMARVRDIAFSRLSLTAETKYHDPIPALHIDANWNYTRPPIRYRGEDTSHARIYSASSTPAIPTACAATNPIVGRVAAALLVGKGPNVPLAILAVAVYETLNELEA